MHQIIRTQAWVARKSHGNLRDSLGWSLRSLAQYDLVFGEGPQDEAQQKPLLRVYWWLGGQKKNAMILLPVSQVYR